MEAEIFMWIMIGWAVGTIGSGCVIVTFDKFMERKNKNV